MKCVATWSFEPWLNSSRDSKQDWHSTSEMLSCFVASIESFNKFYSRPTIYTDSLGQQVLSQLTDKCDFVVAYDNLYDTIPSCLWAYSKILTYQKQNEPYVHFDLDFIIHSKLDVLEDTDVAFQVFEEMIDPKTNDRTLRNVYNLGEHSKHYKLPNILCKSQQELDKIKCPNLGIFYIKDMELNREYTDLATRLVMDNIELFNTNKRLNICSVEQQTLGILLHEHPEVTVKTLLNNHWTDYPFTDSFVHFVGNWKQHNFPGVIELQNKYYGHVRSSKVDQIALKLDEIKKTK
jgi:hypothetical protein